MRVSDCGKFRGFWSNSLEGVSGFLSICFRSRVLFGIFGVMGWSDGMEDDAELEEGEAPYFMDDKSFDPETALSSLSYLDEKVQNVLGHFQKDFEGGVSAENLGPKFGGYGSFLPTCQRSPPIRSQPKSPRVQTQSVLASPNHARREGTSQSSTGIPDSQFSQKNGTTAPYIRQSSHETKVSLGDGPFKKSSSLSSAQAAEKVPLRHEPSPNKSMNPTDQRKLKFRIKFSCDKVAQKNAELYDGLGLISPSSSAGNSPGSAGVPLESRETPDESPGILEMLTTFTGGGASLLSPLQDKFLNLLQNSSLPPLRVNHEHSGLPVDDSGSRPHGGDGFTGNQPKAIRKIEILKKSKGGNRVGSEDNITFRLKDNSRAETPQKNQSISFDTTDKRVFDSLANTGESSRDSYRVLEVVREPENGEKFRKRDVSKDKAKGRILGADLIEPIESMAGQGGIMFGRHEAKNGSVEKVGKNIMKGSQDVSLDQSKDKRIKGNRIPASIRGDSDFSESDRDSRGASDNLVKKSHPRAASLEQDELCMAGMTNKSERKKKSRVSQVNNVKLYSDSVQESGRVGGSLVEKEKKGIKKGANKVRNTYKDIFETNTEPSVRPVDMFEKPSSDRLKDPKFDTVKEKNVHADKFKEKSSYHRPDNQLNSEKLAKNPPAGSVPLIDGLPLLSEQATVDPVVVQDKWVGCDRCQKWRLLPYGTKSEELPEKWICSMLNWLPGMNRCDISEEETTNALHSLYQIPPPENQNGAQYQPGINSVDQVNFNYQNVVSDYMTDGRKKLHKLNETSNKGSKAVLSSAAKNFQLDAVKMEDLNDMKQLTNGVNSVKKSSGQHHSKSDNSKHSNRQKQEHVPGGNANLKRKIKRESDQFGHGNTKRFKSECTLNNLQASGENLGRTGVGSNSDIPTMGLAKEKRRTSESSYSKDAKAGEVNGFQPSAKKRANFGGTVPLDMKNYNDGEKSAKRRNLKNWQNSPSNLEAVRSDGSYLNNNSMPVKEESSDSEFRKNKKPRMSQTDGKDFRLNIPNNEQMRKDMMNIPLSSGSKETAIARVRDKEKQLKKYRIKIASQLTMEDLESLKRDLGSEPLSTTATSSSSKVSDSRKSRTNYQEVKGSPVESVSSSPVRMSKPNKNSLMRVDICGADDVRGGDFSITSPRKMVNGKKGSSTTKKKKDCDVLHPEALNYPVPETGGRDKFGGKSEASPKPSAFGNGHLDVNHLGMSEHVPCPTDFHASESCYSKGIGNKNQHYSGMSLKQKSGKSSLPPKDKGRAAGFNCEGTRGKVSDLPNNQGISNSKQTWTANADTDQSQVTPCCEVSDNVNHSFPGRSGLKSIKTNKNVGKMDSKKWGEHTRKNQLKCGEHERTATKLGNPCSVDTTIQKNLNDGFQAQISCREGNLLVDYSKDKLDIPTSGKLAPGTQDAGLLLIRPCDIPVVADVSKESKDLQNAIDNGESHHGISQSAADSSVRDIVGPSLVRRDPSGQAASLVLKEAEGHRDYADRLKDSGFDYESNEAYFQAALEFLHGASLLESNESGKLGEMNQLQIYINAAKLCETVAQEYEKVAQMAAAALAYKCMEVAYMRVVYCKNSSTNRLCHDLQMSLQMTPQGESPSSSASDIDNLNNQALVDKTSLSKSNGTHYGSNIIASRNRPSFARLFDFTKDVNSAMGASRKSHIAFSAANAILEEAQNKEGIVSVKRVIDFSFQDVEEFVRLVRNAQLAISRQ